MVFEPADGQLRAVAARIANTPGAVVACDLPAGQIQSLVDRVDLESDHEVRLVLGAACTTAAKAIDHLVGALQLPYDATRGWIDLLDSVGDRPAALRRTVIVADAAELLKHEDQDRWRELVHQLHGGPHCLGGGWSTVALVDDPWRWKQSWFGSAAAAQAAAAR
jgi:hypothetical protein